MNAEIQVSFPSVVGGKGCAGGDSDSVGVGKWAVFRVHLKEDASALVRQGCDVCPVEETDVPMERVFVVLRFVVCQVVRGL